MLDTTNEDRSIQHVTRVTVYKFIKPRMANPSGIYTQTTNPTSLRFPNPYPSMTRSHQPKPIFVHKSPVPQPLISTNRPSQTKPSMSKPPKNWRRCPSEPRYSDICSNPLAAVSTTLWHSRNGERKVPRSPPGDTP
jgi:hypothetical protein